MVPPEIPAALEGDDENGRGPADYVSAVDEAFAAWQKANGGHPAPRTVKIEYVAADGAAILELQLERCMPTEVLPQGANGTTRIAMTCGGVRAR